MNIDSRDGLGYIASGWYIFVPPGATLLLRRLHLRRTALSMLLAKGLSKYDLMVIAGHAKFETTQQFYLAVEDKLVDRARVATSEGFGEILARAWHTPCFESQNEKGQQR